MNDLSESVWADILGHLRTHHPSIARGWFSQLRPGPLANGVVTIIAANAAQLSYLHEHCVRPFVEASQAATGRLVSVAFEAANGETLESAGYSPAIPGDDAPSLRLNGDYVFENFVVGPCNRMAHATCMAVSQSPGTTYNPLFIHGAAGLGKTHLLHAVCHRILDHAPGTRIVFLSCETFVNHFIEAVERGALNNFRYRYRHADVLMIDDVQFLSGRDRTQEEFFHTFNTLYQLHRQIVLSADAPPSDIPQLEERLVSRFKWGLVTRIDPPCLETRLAIINKKMRILGIDLPQEVAQYVASHFTANARELEGAINRLHSTAALESRPIDMELSRAVLGGEENTVRRQVRIQDIMGLVTERFDVKLSDLQGRRRSRSIALPRQVCMYLARRHTPHSLEEIGGFFGGRDHTTVLHAVKLIGRLRQQDTTFRQRVDEMEESLRKTN
ncbi:MAG: chromosomal replication initiator protein DnaA [Planctomycetota bacterium]|nr:MAG: chromosomal replication initiator protein DnaA [Planctomycetota bacterium]